ESGVVQALPPTPDEQQAAATSTPARVREGVLVGRFRFIYALLALLIGVSVGGFIVLWGHNSVSGPPWSAWVPTGSESQEMKDIARFVGAQYRLDDGSKLVNVDVSRPPSFQQVPLPVKYMVIQTGATSANV